jgi:hypothetical protein
MRFVTVAAITYAPNLALLIVCALCAVALAFLAFRLRSRAKLRSSSAPYSPEKKKDSFAQRLAAEAGHSPQHVIRLPSTPGPVSSAEMTQQEKIAAALQKAGISNPAWSASSDPEQSASHGAESEKES